MTFHPFNEFIRSSLLILYESGWIWKSCNLTGCRDIQPQDGKFRWMIWMNLSPPVQPSILIIYPGPLCGSNRLNRVGQTHVALTTSSRCSRRIPPCFYDSLEILSHWHVDRHALGVPSGLAWIFMLEFPGQLPEGVSQEVSHWDFFAVLLWTSSGYICLPFFHGRWSSLAYTVQNLQLIFLLSRLIKTEANDTGNHNHSLSWFPQKVVKSNTAKTLLPELVLLLSSGSYA